MLVLCVYLGKVPCWCEDLLVSIRLSEGSLSVFLTDGRFVSIRLISAELECGRLMRKTILDFRLWLVGGGGLKVVCRVLAWLWKVLGD